MRARSIRRPRWLPTRIRSKLIFLHTTFSLGLALLLLIVLRPALTAVMDEAELEESRLALELERLEPGFLGRNDVAEIAVRTGSAEHLGLSDVHALSIRDAAPESVVATLGDGQRCVVRWDAEREAFVAAAARISGVRGAVNRLYLLLTIALLAVYGLIALTIEVFVLPRQVYEPIETLRAADQAVQEGKHKEALIPESRIPPDELGEIMRSRNQSITKLREHEEALATALQRVELTASELKRKNHLLETARRNLADQDRLVSLGMLAAGIAHELNTPLAVLKGCVEEIADRSGPTVTPERAALMSRTVRRLERLSESLLDFARVRPPKLEPVNLKDVVQEAWTLVRMNRSIEGVRLDDSVPDSARAMGDPDRLMQVLVNLLRNSAQAMDGKGHIRVWSDESEREGRRWISLTVADTGPGIDPLILDRLFEPFRSTRLDSHGTGLGLAVAEGIVREHGGVLLARNAPAGGAEFEIMLPLPAEQSFAPEPDATAGVEMP